ncbi:MAG: ABC transporter [Desulfovibrio sp.]|nr:ABC transporter [Desulfovibrio sp.]|tara:strand:- start:9201 stop:10694 length:1494 start_codon:yes stop_codon:yes gene_type:complete
MCPLISLNNCTVTRNGSRLVGPVSLTIERGKHLALIGANGSGKTTLLRLLRGEFPPDGGGIRLYDFGEGEQSSALGLRHRIGLVSAELQEYYTLHAPRTSGRSIILAGFFDTPLLYSTPSPEQEAQADAIINTLGIHDLADADLGTLSTGQMRKLVIARALASRPDILLLDESMEGLDAASREEVRSLLDKAGNISTLVCAAHRIGDVPETIEQTVVIEGGTVVASGSRQYIVDHLGERRMELLACDLPDRQSRDTYDFLLRLRHCSVVAGGTRILYDINWTVLPGENWLVLGANGAGKSTLLKLITSEVAPYADDDDGIGTVERLGGLTMDEARPRIGVVSPALQINYARELAWEVTALETVLSGYRGSVGMLDQPTDEELEGARTWLKHVRLDHLSERPLRRLSYGQQRRVFLARAMAPAPALLLLDEPMTGLDAASRGVLLGLLQQLAESGVPIIMVTHHAEDRIPAINRVMTIENGRQAFVGTLEEYEKSASH